MLNIPEEFLKEEIRWDFTISEAMKRGWAIQLSVLNDILEIAGKHHIPVWMEYGSLLGAVRHKGYVPWDDDIDICMLRADYMRFLHILEKELPPYRQVYSVYTTDEERYNLPKAFVSSRHCIDIGIDPREIELTKQFYNCPYSAGVDIFPLDYIPKDPDQWNYIKQIYNIVYSLSLDYKSYVQTGELDSILSELESTLNYKISRDGNVNGAICRLADAIAMMTTKEEAAYVAWYPEYMMCGDRRKRTLDAYSDTNLMDFEMLKAPVPIGYDEVLRTEYGDEYMTPIKGATGHLYPYYKIQDIKILFNNRIGQIGDIF